jgi:hypothetical protein
LGDLPPVIHGRCEGKSSLPHDLGPQMQCGIRVAPRIQRKRRPDVLHLLADHRGRFQEHLVGITPGPVFARLEAPDHRVRRGLEVLRSMLAGRAIAAANMAAAEAQPEVNPAASGLEALLAARWCMWLDRVKLCDVRTAPGHGTLGVTVRL